METPASTGGWQQRTDPANNATSLHYLQHPLWTHFKITKTHCCHHILLSNVYKWQSDSPLNAAIHISCIAVLVLTLCQKPVNSRNTDRLQKPPVPRLVKEFPVLYGTRSFTTACHLTLFWARSIQSMLYPPTISTSFRSILISSCHHRHYKLFWMPQQ
jgi:hypothetical protein